VRPLTALLSGMPRSFLMVTNILQRGEQYSAHLVPLVNAFRQWGFLQIAEPSMRQYSRGSMFTQDNKALDKNRYICYPKITRS